MTATEEIQELTSCPICDRRVDLSKLTRFGLSHEQLSV